MLSEWVQSLPGVFTLGVGTLSLGSAIGTVWAVVRGAKATKGVGELVGVIEGAKDTIVDKDLSLAQKEVELINKDAELIQKNTELAEAQEVQALLLRSMSAVVAASGIDTVTKLALVNDLEAAKTRSIQRSKDATELIQQKRLEAEELIVAKTKMTVEEYNAYLRNKIATATTKTEEAKATVEQKILDTKNEATKKAQDIIAQGAEKGSTFLNNALDTLNKAKSKYSNK